MDKFSQKYKKLAFFTSRLDKTHPYEGFIYEWANNLSKNVNELVIFTFNLNKNKLNNKNTIIYELKATNKIKKLILLFIYFYRENRKKKFIAIFTHMYGFMGVISLLLSKVFNLKSIFWYAGGIKIPKISLDYLSLKFSDLIFTCSENEKKRYIKELKVKKPIIIINHGISLNIPNKTKINKLKNIFIIGYAARLTSKKNFETLISALKKIKSSKKIFINIAASRLKENKAYLSKIKRQIKTIKDQNKIIQIKTVPYSKIAKYYQSLDLYIHPSKMTSIDKSAIEAIFCKIPVLLSESGFKNIAPSKYLFDPNDDQALAKKIESAIRNYDKFSESQKKLQEKIIKEFSIENFTKKISHYIN